MKKLLTLMALALTLCLGAQAQRFTDKLDRGLVAVKTESGVYCSWRIQADEYYDVKYNLYKNGSKIAENLNVSNYTDGSGSTSDTYTVKAVVNGSEQEASKPASVITNSYKTINLTHDSSLKCTYIPNDACCADVDGDGELEILMKFDNSEESAQLYPKNGPVVDGASTKEYSLLEVIKQDGTLLWWVNCGPNMGDFQNNEQNIVGYDWDMDTKAEVVMRLVEGAEVHMADGTVYTIGADGKNGTSWTNYRIPKAEGSSEWFTYYGKEFLWYCEGATGKLYQCIDYPLKRLEDGETDLKTAWGDGYGHRANKHFFGAPYLDGKHPSIFIGRGIYTRHKFIAYDVDPSTHKLKERWRWTNNKPGSPWYGQGYHNYTIADVDWDGRDEIVWGSMVIDDNGNGLSTTGLGHGDSHHIGDFNPYVHGQEEYACNEDQPANNFRDATTSKIYYRLTGTDDDGRALAGNFTNDYPGAMGWSAHDTPISTVKNAHVSGLGSTGVTQNFRIYWDGDLQEESFDGLGTMKKIDGTWYYIPGEGGIFKYGQSTRIEALEGSITNNYTKATPCYQGDIYGDWREEVIMRTADNNIRIYTTTTPTTWRNYSLWYDQQYRNAMVWQPCGYNQTPHTSYFLGKLEGITIAPPPLTTTGREEVSGSITSSLNGKHALLDTTGDATVSVANGTSPSIFTDNAPSWVQGSAPSECTTKDTEITYTYYTHTLTGGAFTGNMRLVKQGDGTLVLPDVTETYTGNTDVWAGKLNFDGTMEKSPVWLNRFAELNSNGGNFKAGITADYGSIIRPGGANKIGSITVSDLKLNFGSRVVFDINGSNVDKISATTLTIEKKTWENGPEYSAPVFEFSSAPATGTYTLAEVGTLAGDVANIIVEGLSGKKYTLSYADGKLKINIEEGRVAVTNTWTGATNNVWDLMNTQNFSSVDKQFATGDAVVFDDNASTTDVTVAANVSPASVVFKNADKAYTLSGDYSIEGDIPLSVEGTGSVTINNTNKFTGGVTVTGGTLTPKTLANNDGLENGSLGPVDNSISLNEKGTLQINTNITASHAIVLGNNGGVINTGKGATLILNGGVRKGSGTNCDLYKAGTGTLQLNCTADYDKLYLNGGTVYDFQDAHFKNKTIVFDGYGLTLQANNSIYGDADDNVNIEVEEGKNGTWYPDGRCTYTGKLTGAGTINIYATWIRCYFRGNWSEFTGTINAKRGSKVSYEPVFDFSNTYGIPNATLNVDAAFTASTPFNTNGKSFSIGELTGSGYISNGGNDGSGTNTLTIGTKNTDFTFTGSINGSNVVKTGTGVWTVSSADVLANAKLLTIAGGALLLNKAATTSMTTSNAVTVKTGGELRGIGYTNGVTLLADGVLRPGSYGSDNQTSNIGTTTIAKNLDAQTGSHIYFNQTKGTVFVKKPYSYLTINGNATLNGIIHVTYDATKWTPTVETSIKFIECSGTLSGTPTFDLQALPAGMAWDTSSFMTNGTIKIVEGTGIFNVNADAEGRADIYSIGGYKVATINTTEKTLISNMKAAGLHSGLYVVRMGKTSKTIMIK